MTIKEIALRLSFSKHRGNILNKLKVKLSSPSFSTPARPLSHFPEGQILFLLPAQSKHYLVAVLPRIALQSENI